MRSDPPWRAPVGGAIDGGGQIPPRTGDGQTVGNCGTAKLWGLKPAPGHVSPAAIIGKPVETLGRQSYGAVAAKAAMLAGLRFSKTRETVRRKAILGAKAHRSTPCQPGCRILCIRNYCKERKTL